MSFIRPEAEAALRRYGELAIYGGVAAWGLWQGAVLLGRGAWTGGVLLAIGVLAALGLFGAVERTLVAWRGRRAGPGTVNVREGQIAYFGPLGGAIMAMDALTRVGIRTTERGGIAGDLFWVLEDEFGQMVEVPGGADGAVALLDRLGTLPGFDHRAVVMATASREPGMVDVWTKDRRSRLG